MCQDCSISEYGFLEKIKPEKAIFCPSCISRDLPSYPGSILIGITMLFTIIGNLMAFVPYSERLQILPVVFSLWVFSYSYTVTAGVRWKRRIPKNYKNAKAFGDMIFSYATWAIIVSGIAFLGYFLWFLMIVIIVAGILTIYVPRKAGIRKINTREFVLCLHYLLTSIIVFIAILFLLTVPAVRILSLLIVMTTSFFVLILPNFEAEVLSKAKANSSV